MRNYLCAGLMILFLAGSFGAASPQELQKENIAVLRFSGWQGPDPELYQDAFTDKVSTLITQSRRFNLIDRVHLERIAREQALQMSGLIDEATAVEFGRLIGAQKLLVGSFTSTTVEQHDKEYKVYDPQEGKEVKVADSYFSASVTVSLQLVDVESGRYIKGAQAGGFGKGTNVFSAFGKALDEVAANVVEAFFEYFAIHGFIESLDESRVILDRGASLGIEPLMNFEILAVTRSDLVELGRLTISGDTPRIGLLKIVNTEEHSSQGRLIGDCSGVRAGHLIREIKEELTIEARIIQKDGGHVVIDMGADVGLARGTTFHVFRAGHEYRDALTGEFFGIEERKIGIVYLSEVGERFSRGRILEGRYRVKENMVLREADPWRSNYMASVSYARYGMTASANTTPWQGEVGNDHVASVVDSVDYGDREDVDSGSMIKLQFGKWNALHRLSYTISIGRLSVNDDLRAIAGDFTLTKHFDLVPEFSDCYIGVGIGIATARQKLKPEIIGHLSGGGADDVSSLGGQWLGKVGVRFALGGMGIFGEVDYILATFDEWSYSVEYTDADGKQKTSRQTIPNHLLPYPRLEGGGPNFRVGVLYNIKGLTRIFWIF